MLTNKRSASLSLVNQLLLKTPHLHTSRRIGALITCQRYNITTNTHNNNSNNKWSLSSSPRRRLYDDNTLFRQYTTTTTTRDLKEKEYENDNDDNFEEELAETKTSAPPSSFDKIIQMIQEGSNASSSSSSPVVDNERELEHFLKDLLAGEYSKPSKASQLITAVFYYAIEFGNTRILQHLLDHEQLYGKKLDMTDLEVAVSGGGEKRVQVAKIFMDKLAESDPNGSLSFRHLLTCVYNGDLSMTKFLIENYQKNPVYWHTVNANHKHRESSNTVLHFAAMNFRSDTVRYLLEEQQQFKIVINNRNVAGFTPLEALVHRVVLRRENQQSLEKEPLEHDDYARALETAKLLEQHGCIISDHFIIERAGEDFVNVLKRSYTRAKDQYELSL